VCSWNRQPRDLTAIGVVHPYPKGAPESIAEELTNVREWVRASFGEQLETGTPNGVTRGGCASLPCGARNPDSLEHRVSDCRWYDLQDDGRDAADPEQNYGLLDASGNEKPAMQAVRIAMNGAKERQYAGMIQNAPAGIPVMRFDGPGDVLFIVWNDRPGKPRTIWYAKKGSTLGDRVDGQYDKTEVRWFPRSANGYP
jgi:hypothetical protein